MTFGLKAMPPKMSTANVMFITRPELESKKGNKNLKIKKIK